MKRLRYQLERKVRQRIVGHCIYATRRREKELTWFRYDYDGSSFRISTKPNKVGLCGIILDWHKGRTNLPDLTRQLNISELRMILQDLGEKKTQSKAT